MLFPLPDIGVLSNYIDYMHAFRLPYLFFFMMSMFWFYKTHYNQQHHLHQLAYLFFEAGFLNSFFDVITHSATNQHSSTRLLYSAFFSANPGALYVPMLKFRLVDNTHSPLLSSVIFCRIRSHH